MHNPTDTSISLECSLLDEATKITNFNGDTAHYFPPALFDVMCHMLNNKYRLAKACQPKCHYERVCGRCEQLACLSRPRTIR